VSPAGRPRSAEADRAILDAALELLYEHGYSGMSMEAVAESAGVGKTTVYRRYRDKADLVTAAIAELKRGEEVPDSGDTKADLLELLQQVVRSKERVQNMRLLGMLWADQERNPELLRLFRERVIAPRRQTMVDVLRRGQERGQVRADVDPALATEMMVGAHFARQFNGHRFTRDWAHDVVETMWPALEAR
jgi:AcrR family transcriptional regulator